MGRHAYNPSSPEGQAGGVPQFESSLVYTSAWPAKPGYTMRSLSQKREALVLEGTVWWGMQEMALEWDLEHKMALFLLFVASYMALRTEVEPLKNGSSWLCYNLSIH